VPDASSGLGPRDPVDSQGRRRLGREVALEGRGAANSVELRTSRIAEGEQGILFEGSFYVLSFPRPLRRISSSPGLCRCISSIVTVSVRRRCTCSRLMQFQESFEHGESPRQQHRNSISNPQGTASPSSFIVLFILCNMIVVFQKDHFSVKKKKTLECFVLPFFFLNSCILLNFSQQHRFAGLPLWTSTHLLPYHFVGD
jgi:hypothetical protein